MSGSDEHKCAGVGASADAEHRHDITCREIGEFLLAYLERELDPGERAEFERHLELCPPCVHYLDGYRETVELVRRCVRDEGEPACGAGEHERKHKPPEGLIQAILAAKRSTERDG